MNLETSLARALAASDASAVDLAHCQPFRLGPVEVVPASRSLQVFGADPVAIQPLAMRVLIALAAAGGETRSRDDLVEACWSQRIVGDDAVHRIISTLRRDLAQVSGGAVAIETIPKVGYRLRVDGDLADSATEAVGSGSAKVARPWLGGLLLLAGIVSAGVLTAMRPNDNVTAIAVVADGHASSSEGARFASGLSGDLARLASTMPSLAFVEADGGLAGERLVLRVALDTKANLPSAHVRLIDNKAGAVVWAREFEAEKADGDDLRERVANGVTGVLQCGLDRSAGFHDPVGLRLYLGACEGLETSDFVRARAFAQQITTYAPESPAGWACLANSTIFAAAKGGVVPPAELARAESYARRALAVDPSSGLAYVALAMASSWRGEPMLHILERGIRVDPDFAMVHQHYARALSAAGLVQRAVDPGLRAVALHPHEPGVYQLAVAALFDAGRTEEALSLSKKMQRLWRYDEGVELQRLETLFHAADPDAALAKASASPLRSASRTAAHFEALTWRADPTGYDWSRFDRVAQKSYADNPKLAWSIAFSAARMGDFDRAHQWLARAPANAFMAWTPLFAAEVAPLRRDVRFFDKMASVGMVARWRKSGRWPDFCSEPGLSYDCRRRAAELAVRSVAVAGGGGRCRVRTYDPLIKSQLLYQLS